MKLFFRLAAVSNWVLCGGGLFLLKQHFGWLGEPVPEHLGMHYFQLLIGIYFGWMYWEIGADPLNRLLLMKFGLIAKSVGAAAWIALILLGLFSPANWPSAIVSDIAWVPFFAYFYFRARRLAAEK